MSLLPFTPKRRPRKPTGSVEHRSPTPRAWSSAIVLALVVHVAMWWMPVSMPAMKLEPPRVIRIKLAKIPPRPKVRKPKPRKKIAPKKKLRKRRRWKRRRRWRRRRVRRKLRKRRRKPRKRVVQKPKVQPKKYVKRVAKAAPNPIPPPIRRPVARPRPAPPAPRPMRKVDIRGYGMSIYRAIQRHKRYPLMAYKMRFEGRVIVLIRIARSGKLLGKPRVVRSSGHGILDQEAVRMVLAATPLRPIPRGYAKSHVSFHVPVSFKMPQ